VQQPCNGVYKWLKMQGLFRHDGHGDRRPSRGAIPESGMVGAGRLQMVSRSVVGERGSGISDC
jgi:hypothetical protein